MKNQKHVAAHHHEKLSHHARALVTATQHIAEDKVAQARARLAEIVDDAKERLEMVEETARETAKKTDEFIREKPYHALGIGVAFGMLLGMYLARRK